MAGRILVLDDEENYAEMLQELLRDHKFCVDMATRPERAIDQLMEIPYDLVISDYKMPVMDGADFLKRARELYPNLPFILVSGLMNTPELVKVANMSVTLVMEKPLDTGEFLKQVSRFSQPMTEDEMSAQAKEVDVPHAQAGELSSSLPEEPRFFSAASPSSKLFLQNAWSIAGSAHHLFVLEPVGGDAELAAKDISAWRGNSDLPVANFVLPNSNQAAIERLRGIFTALEQSNTVCIRLESGEQIAQARELTETALKQVEGVANMPLIFILESEQAASYLAQAGAQGIALPELSERSSDIAAYARRFARIASERCGKKNCSAFTPEAAFLMLTHTWPRGYREVQEAVMRAVNEAVDDQPISAQLLKQALGIDGVQIPAPGARLEVLMQHVQSAYLDKMLSESGIPAADLVEQLELGSGVQTRDELLQLPLIERGLAQL